MYGSERYFDNADTYDPDRWLDGRVAATAAREGLALNEFFAPFLVGNHVCLGRQLAEVEARTIVARWLWRFDIAYAGQAPPRTLFSLAHTINALPVTIRARTDEHLNK